MSTISNTVTAGGLHKKAAQDHEAAAKHHHKAAESHEKNKMNDAKDSSRTAMGCCDAAVKSSKAACSDTAR